jgi:hypothetical protein
VLDFKSSGMWWLVVIGINQQFWGSFCQFAGGSRFLQIFGKSVLDSMAAHHKRQCFFTVILAYEFVIDLFFMDIILWLSYLLNNNDTDEVQLQSSQNFLRIVYNMKVRYWVICLWQVSFMEAVNSTKHVTLVTQCISDILGFDCFYVLKSYTHTLNKFAE